MILRYGLLALALIVLSLLVRADPAAVEKKGQTSKIKIEQVITGHLSDLSGRYKLRASEVS